VRAPGGGDASGLGRYYTRRPRSALLPNGISCTPLYRCGLGVVSSRPDPKGQDTAVPWLRTHHNRASWRLPPLTLPHCCVLERLISPPHRQ
jgi:hypothetical protein